MVEARVEVLLKSDLTEIMLGRNPGRAISLVSISS